MPISEFDGQETTGNGLQEYHDYFGTETHDDHILFELLTVGVFQAGLSWKTAAAKLPEYRRVYHGLAIDEVAKMDEPDIEAILNDPQMIRNHHKVQAVITNARAIQQVQQAFGSFDAYLWHFVDGQPLTIPRPATDAQRQPGHNPMGQQVAKDMKARGFAFVGPSVAFMFMRAAGLIQHPDDPNQDAH